MESQPWKLCHWEVFETDNLQDAKQKFFFPRILTSSSSLIDDRAAIADAIPAFLAWTRDWTTWQIQRKKKISKVCVQSQNNPQPSTLKNSSATIKVNIVKRFEGLVIKVVNRIVIIFILWTWWTLTIWWEPMWVLLVPSKLAQSQHYKT